MFDGAVLANSCWATTLGEPLGVPKGGQLGRAGPQSATACFELLCARAVCCTWFGEIGKARTRIHKEANGSTANDPSNGSHPLAQASLGWWN